MAAIPSVLVELFLLASVSIDEGRAYQFNMSLPDSAEPEVDACIERSRNTVVIPWQAELACVHDYFTQLGPNNLTDKDWDIFRRTSKNGWNIIEVHLSTLLHNYYGLHDPKGPGNITTLIANTGRHFTAATGFGHHPPPTGVSIRREIRTLSKEEWHNVTDVFRQLFEAGTLQAFGRLHGQAKLRAHKGAAFLPWHRVFVTHFEQEMRSINPSVSLPYWDYTIDHDIPQPFESVLWTPCYFGENNDTVQSGPFSFFYGAHGAVISRDLAKTINDTRLISKRDIDLLKDFCDFNDITTSAVESKDSHVLEHNLESLHDSVHDYIGGDMGVVENSAYDPVFWFHHAFIDYIWESFREHQIEKCSYIDIESNYRPLNDIGRRFVKLQGPEDAMFGYGHLKNIDGLWLNWTKQFYIYEPQPSCGSTCSGKYLYCEDGNRCLTSTKEKCIGTESNPVRVLREVQDVDSLIPKLPCEAGTELKGLIGDGRTRDTSKAECERILKKQENVEDVDHVVINEYRSSNDGGKNFGFVVLGAVLMLPVVIGTYCYLRRKHHF